MEFNDRSTENQRRRAWRVVAASLAGTCHTTARLPCQDTHLWKILPGGTLVAAVSDGASSAALAEVGAKVAAHRAVEALISLWPAPVPAGKETWHDLFTAAFQAARASIEETAQAYHCSPRDLASTLILLAACPGLVAAMQVGDGAAVVGDANGNIFSITAPLSTEYINETTFLASPNYLESAQCAVWCGDAKHIALLSDGLQMLALKMPGGQPHGPFFAPLFDFLASREDQHQAQEQLIQFLSSARIQNRTDDDVTLLLATLVQL